MNIKQKRNKIESKENSIFLKLNHSDSEVSSAMYNEDVKYD